MMESLSRILALIRKELLAILKDPRSRISLFVPPVVQCLIFGYAATYDLNHVPYAILDQDRSFASRELVSAIDGSGNFERVAQLSNATEIRRLIDERKVLLVVQIGQDFERKLAAGGQAPVQIILDGRNSNTAGTALGYVAAIVNGFNVDWAAKHGTAPAGIRTEIRAWYNPNLVTRWFMVPSLIGVLTLLQMLLLTAMSVAREREQGTLDQLLVTPYRPPEIIVGKAVPPVLIGLIQATLILFVAQLWFRIPFAGSYVTLYIGLLLFLTAAIGIGLIISSVVHTMQQSVLSAFVIMMPLALLSGLATPIANMPVAFQYFTFLNPLRYAIDIAQRVYLEGAGLGNLMPDLWPLALIALLTLSGTAWRFRRGFE